MFARQSNSFANYSSTPSWVARDPLQQQHQEQQQPQPQEVPAVKVSNSTPSNSDNPYKKKRPLQFEPEFYAALDSSLHERGDYSYHHHHDAHQWEGSACPQLSRSESPNLNEQRSVKRVKKQTLSSSPRSTSSPPPFSYTSSPSSTTSGCAFYTRQQQHQQHQQHQQQQQKLRRTTQHSRYPAPFASPFQSSRQKPPSLHSHSSGPSLIDLSSGEELVALHLGENEHKRRRESIGEPNGFPSTAEDPRDNNSQADSSGPSPSSSYTNQPPQQSDGPDDGFIIPILDPQYSVTQPSAMKRLRLGHSSHSRHHHLRFLSETDCEESYAFTDKGYRRHIKKGCHGRSSFGHPTSTRISNPAWEGVSPFVSFTAHGSGSHSRDSDQGEGESAQNQKSNDAEIMDDGNRDEAQIKAVVPYRGEQQQGHPDKFELVDGIFGSLGWPQFPDVKDVQGNEMVLFKKSSVQEVPPIEELVQKVDEDDDELQALEMDQSEFGYWEEASHPYSSFQIVELSDDDDEGNMADDEGCSTRQSTASSIYDDDSPLAELQEKVMEMDLD